ncbi:type IV pilus biogenesis protein PilM [Oceanobacillus manasiensis]|uniref:type IV pilus biogenesis protein PilM n=1 Tax=Oceanobacillus manasiensis TaxID=586413 RepID=UPI0005A723F7|nr:pilus assembly protein PilM [Oceanobacillus manasiensis]
MGFISNGRVNIVITNRKLRYTFHKNNKLEGLQEHGELELPPSVLEEGKIMDKAGFSELIRKLVQEHKWKRKKLLFAVPDDTVVIRQIEVPAALSREEARDYIETQLGNSIYLPFANPSIAIDFLEKQGDKQHILLFAYPKEKINDFVEVFEQQGLRPVVADLTSLSVYRYYMATRKETTTQNHILHVHWNAEALVLTAFKENKPIFTRHMKMEKAMENSDMDRTINEYLIEINRIIDFYQYSITKGTSQIELLLLSGDYAGLPALKQRFIEGETLAVEDFSNGELPSKYTDVLGLAMKNEV